MGTAILMYDADCGICTASVDWIRRNLAQQPEIVASRDIDPAAFGLTAQDLGDRAWMHTPTGNWGGHEAVAGVLLMQHDWRWRLLGNLLLTPPYSWLARLGYALIARNRQHIHLGPQQCKVPQR